MLKKDHIAAANTLERRRESLGYHIVSSCGNCSHADRFRRWCPVVAATVNIDRGICRAFERIGRGDAKGGECQDGACTDGSCEVK